MDPGAPAPSAEEQRRRASRRRTAGPARDHIAANDDAPTIGGLIFALHQKPSNQPFRVAAIASGVWSLIGVLLGWSLLAAETANGGGFVTALFSPTMALVLVGLLLPIALFWFLALLAWRAQELKLMSSAMTEVAVRLAEPDRGAEQHVASLGQAVRRQVSFMNEAIGRALGRAGELEALVQNEVATLEKSYGENEHKIKGLIQELVGERHALVSTTDKVAETLKAMGSDVPALIDKLSQQQIKLAKIIEGAGQNLIALESQLATATGNLETSLANRTQQLQAVLDDYTVALDATLASRAEALDAQLVERTRALDAAFSERLALFDQSMLRSTSEIDQVVNDKARVLTAALESHVKALSETLGKQAMNLDESMMHGIDAVRRTSDSITRQSLKAIEGLSSQADMLKHVSENLLNQVSGVANRFDAQGRNIVSAASALETANTRIDSTLQRRHAELNDTLTRISGKASELDEVMRGYSATVEGSILSAETRAQQLIQQLAQGTQAHAQSAVSELERLRSQTDTHSQAVVAEFERLRNHADVQAQRTIEDMRARVSGVSQEVTQHLGAIAGRFTDTSDELRTRAASAAADLQREQERLRAEAERLPMAARESAEAMRSALSEQLRALEQLSTLSSRERRSDVTPPSAPLAPASAPMSVTNAYGSAQTGFSTSSAGAQAAMNQPAAPMPAAPMTAPMGSPAMGAGPDGLSPWSLTDLLKRASHDEDGTPRSAPINLDGISRALDQATASSIWARYRAGQRGIMVRSIYTNDGRVMFDEVTQRYQQEQEFRRTVDRFLADFEAIVRDMEHKDPSGRGVQSHLVSDSGRVYLFLAHASGRLM
jgi:ABC-type transporter Mla subunit MlaD